MLKKFLTLTLAFVMLSVAVFSYGEYTINAAYATTTGAPVIAIEANNSDVTADGLTGSVTLNIASDAAYDDAIVVTAVFDGDDFLTAKIDTVDISATEENKPVITLPAAAPTESGEYNVKLFLWESKATLAPIAQPISFVAKHVVQLSTPWNGQAPTEADKPSVGDGSEENPYQISNGNQLAWFAANALATDNAVLTDDIYLNWFDADNNGAFDENWYENGTTGANNWFDYRIGDTTAYSGTFDGNGNTIYGMYLASNDAYLGGMFKTLTGATVKDLKLSGAYVNSSRKNDSTSKARPGASVLAYELNANCLIDEVSVDGLIKAANGTSSGLVGSIVAKINGTSSVTNCVSHVDIDLSKAAAHTDTISDSATSTGVGGIIGFIAKSKACTVTGNKNYGNINAPNSQIVAGIVAYAKNSGAISSFANNENYGVITGGTGFAESRQTTAYCAELVALALTSYVPKAASIAWNHGDNGNVAAGSATGLVTYTPPTEE